MLDRITSPQNARVKKTIKLRYRKYRKELGLVRIEGLREISRAFEAGLVFEEVFVCPEIIIKEVRTGSFDPRLFYKNWEQNHVTIWETTRSVFSKMAFGDRHEGMIALCQYPELFLKDLPRPKNPFYVVVENVEKPGNLGAILRTCDGVGVDGVIVTDMQTDIFNLNVIRSSLGTVFSVPIVQTSNEDARKIFIEQNIHTVAALPQAKKLYTHAKYNSPLAIIVGNEQEGLRSYWKTHSDMSIRIPMRGKADSLNVSTAIAVLLYEVLRQREG
ncbi:MAG: RNA methyltransferase [Candidatus Omnitrophica bacterium]|nr:RNA methyltransferase [Candidatus Omnitrophota bacterium]